MAEARATLERAIAVTLPVDASFADQERAVLPSPNEACRLALQRTLRATATQP